MLRLVNPSIRKFGVYFPQASQADVERLGRGLARMFPSMRNLEAASPPLRRLELGPTRVEIDHLCPLSALPHLEHLAISLGAREPPNLRIALPELRSLAVSCDGFGVIGAVLAHVEMPQLQTFSLTETHENSSDMSRELPAHLRTLVAKYLLAPLLVRRAMRRLVLCLWFEGPVVPFTPAFHAIAEAWPDLETFSLKGMGDSDADDGDGGGGMPPLEQYADLGSVVAFARHCPRLCSLHIPLVQLDPSFEAESSDAESATADRLAHLEAPAPHYWLRELIVEQVQDDPGPGHSEEGEDRQGDRELGLARLRGLLGKVFPFASIRC
uniref:Peptidyl-lysine N-acetyltransferase Pat ) n=1 Tax=Ganoderma boninense TaxID=34458 RepID=A0A5K1JVQ2_9APHY|nr:Peptidyl-lysine N-acetyltransferase Pat (EC (Protein lysine acetyltransferase) [Ganoderma boninense]